MARNRIVSSALTFPELSNIYVKIFSYLIPTFFFLYVFLVFPPRTPQFNLWLPPPQLNIWRPWGFSAGSDCRVAAYVCSLHWISVSVICKYAVRITFFNAVRDVGAGFWIDTQETWLLASLWSDLRSAKGGQCHCRCRSSTGSAQDS